MDTQPTVRHAVRVLLLDERNSVLLFRAQDPHTGSRFWFPAGGGLEDGESVETAAKREVAEETGLGHFILGPEVWHRRHVFTWNGVTLDQRERWFIAHVRRFEPDGQAMTQAEKVDLKQCRWWTLEQLTATDDLLTPRNFPHQLRSLLADGPPTSPIEIGI